MLSLEARCFLEDRICNVAYTAKVCAALDLMLLISMSMNDTIRELMEQIKSAYRDLWGRK